MPEQIDASDSWDSSDSWDLVEVRLEPRRFPRGTREGGQFRPRVGGVAHAVKRRLLHELFPEMPRSPRERSHVRRQVNVEGRHITVPEQRPFDRTIGGRRYTSPSGSTELYRDGKPFSPTGTTGHHRAPLDVLLKPDVAGRIRRRTEELGVADLKHQDAVARAKAALVAHNQETLPAQVGEEGFATDEALREAGFLEADFRESHRGLEFSYVAPDGVSRLTVGYSRDGAQVAEVDWRPAYPPAPSPPLDRPPRTWEEFTADLDSFSRTTARAHGRYANLGPITVDSEFDDHTGLHEWGGRVRLGPEVRGDILVAAAVRARGNDLTDAQRQRVWAATEAGIHEMLHASNPIGRDDYDGLGEVLEEGLTEELARVETVKRLRLQGQHDVVQWAADHPTSLRVVGTYTAFRSAIDEVLNEAKVAPEDRPALIERLKLDTAPRDRVDLLAGLVARARPELGDGEARAAVSRILTEGLKRNAAREFNADVPLLALNADPSQQGRRHEIGGEVLEVGDKVIANLWRDGKAERVEGTVTEIHDGDGWSIDADFGTFGTELNLPPRKVVAVTQTQQGDRLIMGAQASTIEVDGQTITPGQVVEYDGQPEGATSNARITRIIRTDNPATNTPGDYAIEAITTTKSRRPGTRIILTPARTGGLLKPATEEPALRGGRGTYRRLIPLTLQRHARLARHFDMPSGTVVVPLSEVSVGTHPRPSRLRAEVARLQDPGGSRRLPPLVGVNGEGRLVAADERDSATVAAMERLGETHVPVRLERRGAAQGPWLPKLFHFGDDEPDEPDEPMALDPQKLYGGELVRDPDGNEWRIKFVNMTGHGKKAKVASVHGYAADYSGSMQKWAPAEMKGWEFLGSPPKGGSSSGPKKPSPVGGPVDPKKLRGGEVVKFDGDPQSVTWSVRLTGTNEKPTLTVRSLDGKEETFPEAEFPASTLVKAAPAYKAPPPFVQWDDAHVLKMGKHAGGSNDAHFATDPDGQEWLVKPYRGDVDRVATELLANSIYRELGVRVPEAGTVAIKGKPALAYPLVEGKSKRWDEPNAELGRGFMADALVANWDVVGLSQDNVLWDEEGHPFRVDQGGSFQYRAQGEPKPFGPVPSEVWSMASPKGGQAFGTMELTDAVKKQGARRIAEKLKPARIDELVDAAPFANEKMRQEVREALKARVAWMRDYAAGKAFEPAPAGGPAAREALSDAQAGVKLRPEQAVAVDAFLAGWDGVVNDHLRTGAPKDAASKEVKFLVRELDSVARLVKAPTDLVAYTVLDVGEDAVGKVVTDKGYMGLATDPDEAVGAAAQRGIPVRVLISEGMNVLSPRLLSGSPDAGGQPELVLPRGSRLRLLRAHDGTLEAALIR